jgi:anthranilate phosphoribosyltransferase
MSFGSRRLTAYAPAAMGSFDELGGWPGLLGRLLDRQDLTAEQAGAVLTEILEGRATPAQIAASIVALRIKGETVDELDGMVDAMLSASSPLDLPDGVIDIVGMGGAARRRVAALNVSTMACFVAAGAGAKVCKHGNRRASSTSGSFDLLDALGIAIELDGDAVAACVEQAGIGFCFARAFHPAMRHAGPVRAELGIPTVFNVLGPLSHPGRVLRQVIGVSDGSLAERVIGVLRSRGAPRAMVVHGDDGLDELTVCNTSTVYELRDGDIERRTVDPESVGVRRVAADELPGGDPGTNARLAHELFQGAEGPVREVVVLNAAAGLVVAGAVDTLAAGVEQARASIDQGRAKVVFDTLVSVSNALVD